MIKRADPPEWAVNAAAASETAREAAARRRAEFKRLTEPHQPDLASDLAQQIIRAGEIRRGALDDDVPRDAAGAPLDKTSAAYKIVQAARKARGIK
jgi:hypothetical protein